MSTRNVRGGLGGEMSLVFGIIVGIIVLTILVVTHELGHALVARRYGVRVEEFGIGFPPAAYKKKVKKSFLGKNVDYSKIGRAHVCTPVTRESPMPSST